MEEQKLQSELLPVIQKANQIKIVTDNEYKDAGEFLKSIKGAMKRVDLELDDPINKAYQLHITLTAQKNKFIVPLKNAERIVKDEMKRFYVEQETKRLQEQLRLEAEFKAKQEAEALKAAELAEQSGNKEEAQEIIQDAINNAPAVIVENTTKADGISARKNWKWKLIDRNKIDPKFLVVDEKQIDQIVKAMGKNAESFVGGIMCYEDITISSRSI